MPKFIGIDIGASAIKLVELKKSGNTVELTRAFCVDLDLKKSAQRPDRLA